MEGPGAPHAGPLPCSPRVRGTCAGPREASRPTCTLAANADLQEAVPAPRARAPSKSLTWSTLSTWTPNLPPKPRTESTCEQCLESFDWYSWPTADCNGSKQGVTGQPPQETVRVRSQQGSPLSVPAAVSPERRCTQTVLETWPERQHGHLSSLLTEHSVPNLPVTVG